VSALLYRFGRWCAEHAVRVLAAWLLIILMLGGAVVLTGGKLNNTFTISGTESMTGLDILAQRLPQSAGTSEQVLITADDGDIENHRDAVDGFVQSASDLDGVADLSSCHVVAGQFPDPGVLGCAARHPRSEDEPPDPVS